MYHELILAIGLEALYVALLPDLLKYGYLGGREGFLECRFLQALTPLAMLGAMAVEFGGVWTVRIQVPGREPQESLVVGG